MAAGRAASPQRRGGPASTKRTYEPRQERRQQIVAATIAIIAERGLHEWKTAELATRVGLSEAALFRHFPSKDAILVAAVHQEVLALQRMVIGYDSPGRGWERATGLATAVVDFIAATGGGPLVILTGLIAGTTPELRREAMQGMGVLRKRMTRLFAEAVSGGTQGGAVKPEDLADLAIAIIQSSALRWIMSDRAYPMRARARSMLVVLGRAVPSRHPTPTLSAED